MKPIRLLLVDDTPSVIDNFRKLIQFEPDIEIVAVACTGTEAIKQYERVKPDVVSMDLNMPEMDGITASRKIIERYPEAKIFMLTIQNDTKYMKAAMDAGIMDYIVSPPSREELIHTIKLLAGRVSKGSGTLQKNDELQKIKAEGEIDYAKEAQGLHNSIREIEAIAERYFDGNFTILRTSKGWRSFFGLPGIDQINSIDKPYEPFDESLHIPTQPNPQAKEKLFGELLWLLEDLGDFIEGYFPGKFIGETIEGK